MKGRMPYDDIEDDFPEDDLPETPPDVVEFISGLKDFIKTMYRPAYEMDSKIVLMSTNEIYSNLQNHFPSIYYSPQDVALWLKQMNFQYTNTGQMRFEWMLKPATKN